MRRLLLVGCLVGAAAGGAAWLASDAIRTRDDLRAAESLAHTAVEQAKSGTTPDLRALQERTRRARERTDGPLWRLASTVPVLGQDLAAVRRVAGAAEDLTHDVAPALVELLATVDDGRLVRDKTVDLTLLAKLQPKVQQAADTTERIEKDLTGTTAHGTVDDELDRVSAKVDELDRALETATEVLAKAPDMLGAKGTRHYLVAVQNNAESRATGGLIGIVALVKADHGRLTLERTVTNDVLLNRSAPLKATKDAARTWVDMGSTQAWFDTNLTPHVPDAARNISQLWRAQYGQRLDGVVLLDAVVLEHLLTRPVRLGTTTLEPDKVVDWIAHREYVDHPDPLQRKALLRDLAAELFEQLDGARPLLDAAATGHLFVWSARGEEQALLQGRMLGGTLPADGSPYLQVLTQDFGGNKLAYFLHRHVTLRPAREGVEVTVVLENRALKGLPDYMTVRTDGKPFGQARVGLSVYGGRGSLIGNVTVDGRPVPMRFDTDHGVGLGTLALELPRNRKVVVRLRVTQPAGVLTYRQQPLVRPDVLVSEVPFRRVGS